MPGRSAGMPVIGATAVAEFTKGGFFYHFPDKNTFEPALIESHIGFEDDLFDDPLRRAHQLNEEAFDGALLGAKLLAELHPPNDNVDFDALGDFVSTVVEGGIIMSKSMGEPDITARQVVNLRSYVKLLFTPPRN